MRPDILHPYNYPGIDSPYERPEPYYGIPHIVEQYPTEGNRTIAVQYDDGRRTTIARGFVMGGHVHNNGPACMPFDDVRGNISDSEGMDCPNYAFNNSDCGASF